MQSKYLFRIGLSLALVAGLPVSAHAQFGSIGDRIKKKAKEAVLGKDEKSTGSSESAAASSPARIAITTDVLDRFVKGLAAEQAKRDVVVKRANCVRQAQQSSEYMNLMASQGPELEKISNSNMSDDKKMAELQRIGAVLKEKEDAYMEKKCGPAAERLEQVEYEGVGAEAGGFTGIQYGMLKERIQPFCESAAKGGSGDASLVFTDEEVAAIKPRCAALLPAIKKTL